MFEIEMLTFLQVEEIYETWMRQHFPQNELKPLDHIKRMWDTETYMALGMYHEQELVGYALLSTVMEENVALLDYFAILEDYRNQGAGSYFLNQLGDELPWLESLLIETENIDSAKSEDEQKERKKRDDFYVRNKAIDTGVSELVYGVDYRVWQRPYTRLLSNEECKERIIQIYRNMVVGDKFERFVKIMSCSKKQL